MADQDGGSPSGSSVYGMTEENRTKWGQLKSLARAL